MCILKEILCLHWWACHGRFSIYWHHGGKQPIGYMTEIRWCWVYTYAHFCQLLSLILSPDFNTDTSPFLSSLLWYTFICFRAREERRSALLLYVVFADFIHISVICTLFCLFTSKIFCDIDIGGWIWAAWRGSPMPFSVLSAFAAHWSVMACGCFRYRDHAFLILRFWFLAAPLMRNRGFSGRRLCAKTPRHRPGSSSWPLIDAAREIWKLVGILAYFFQPAMQPLPSKIAAWRCFFAKTRRVARFQTLHAKWRG